MGSPPDRASHRPQRSNLIKTIGFFRNIPVSPFPFIIAAVKAGGKPGRRVGRILAWLLKGLVVMVAGLVLFYGVGSALAASQFSAGATAQSTGGVVIVHPAWAGIFSITAVSCTRSEFQAGKGAENMIQYSR